MKIVLILLMGCLLGRAAETNSVAGSTNQPGIRLTPNQIRWTQMHVNLMNTQERLKQVEERLQMVQSRDFGRHQVNNVKWRSRGAVMSGEFHQLEAARKELIKRVRLIGLAMTDLELKDPSAKREIPKSKKK